MIRLFTTYYGEEREDRRGEYEYCVLRNLACAAIDEIWVFHEGGELPSAKEDRLYTRPCDARPLYNDVFALVNGLVGPLDISIVANTDIWFDESIGLLSHVHWQADMCLALSRWDAAKDGVATLFERGDSQDAWIFRGPIREVNGNFPLGAWDCDNKIAWELEQAGYSLTNPALSLRSYHVHHCGYRSYEEEMPDFGIHPPFKYVEPDNIAGLWTCWRLYSKLRLPYFPWRLTGNKIRRWPPVSLWSRAVNKVKGLKKT